MNTCNKSLTPEVALSACFHSSMYSWKGGILRGGGKKTDKQGNLHHFPLLSCDSVENPITEMFGYSGLSTVEGSQCLLLTQSRDPQVSKTKPHWWVWNESEWTCVVNWGTRWISKRGREDLGEGERQSQYIHTLNFFIHSQSLSFTQHKAEWFLMNSREQTEIKY